MKEIDVTIDLKFDTDEFRRNAHADFDAATTTEQEARVLFACAGNALYRAHLLEMDLRVIVHFACMFDGELSTPEECVTLERSFEGKPLGHVLRKTWEAVQVDESAQRVVEAGRAARNELCHGFFERNAEGLRTRVGRLEALTALIEINLKLREASFITTGTYKGLMTMYGLTEEHVKA